MSDARHRAAAAAGLLLLAGLAGCTTEPRGRMVPIPPPDGWRERLLERRAQKDDYFRRDPETPLLAADVTGFRGLDYWPPDPQYYFVGPLYLYARSERFEIVSTAGQMRPCEKLGWVAFPLGGTEQRLQVYRLLDGDGGLFLPFMDATTGKETYPAGRYIDLEGPDGGPYVLDFNAAYNPSCAYGAPERFQCPVTPPENRLSVPVAAGERGYKQRATSGAGA